MENHFQAQENDMVSSNGKNILPSNYQIVVRPTDSSDSPDISSHSAQRVSESDNSSTNSEFTAPAVDNVSVSCHHFEPRGQIQDQNLNMHDDSDTGVESMSSSGTSNTRTVCPLCSEDDNFRDGENNELREEVNKLKCDKLELLRQNVTCQREIKRLKERENFLQGELTLAGKEILKMRSLLQEYGWDTTLI
jgi:hypothetical protein